MREGEVSGRAPGAPVVEVENIPPRTANILGQIEIALVAGKPVKQHYHWMRTGARGDIDERVEERAVTGNLKTLHGSRIGSPGPLLCIERRQRAQNTQCGEKQTVAQGSLHPFQLFCNYSVPILSERQRRTPGQRGQGRLRMRYESGKRVPGAGLIVPCRREAKALWTGGVKF